MGYIITTLLIVTVACAPGGVTLSGASRGFVSSPNFPGNFPQNALCIWNITVPSGRIKLTFFNFTLEPGDNTDCSGHAQGARLIITNVAHSTPFKLCGQSIPAPVYSLGNYLGIQLVTANNVYSGFNASYETITDDMCKYLAGIPYTGCDCNNNDNNNNKLGHFT